MSRTSEGVADPVRLLRASLERRQFGEGVALVVSGDGVPVERRCTLFEMQSFMEPDADRTAEMVVSFLGALNSAGLETVLWLHGNGAIVRFLYGVVEPDDGPSSPVRNALLRNALEGFFLGAQLREVPYAEQRMLRAELHDRKSASVLLGVPSERESTRLETRLDEALEALGGMAFDLILQCRPAPTTALDLSEENLSFIANVARRLSTVSVSQGDARTFGESLTRGISESRGLTETRSWSSSTSTGTSTEASGSTQQAAGGAVGLLLGAAIGGLAGSLVAPGAGTAAGAKLGASVGTALGGAAAATLSPAQTVTESTSETVGESHSISTSETTSQSVAISAALSLSRQVSFEAANRQARALEELAEQHLERYRRARALGGWATTIHLATSDRGQLDIAAHILLGSLRGDASHLEPLRAVPYAPASVPAALAGLAAFRPPRLAVPAHPFFPEGEQPLTLLTTDELAHWFRPPTCSVAGVLVRRPVRFPRYSPSGERSGRTVELGPVTYWGRTLPGPPLALDTRLLTRHAFIAGSTGAGKTTTVRQILWQLQQESPAIPFLLLEPAKSEYGELFEALKRTGRRPLKLVVGTPRGEDEAALRFNPLAAPAGLPIGRHAEAVKILLRSCFEMQESLPQLLERVLFRAYADCGYGDMTEVVPPAGDGRRFPTLRTLTEATVPGATFGTRESRVQAEVRSLGYEPRVHANLAAALTVRLEAFTRGLKGAIFGGEEVDFGEVLARPTFVQLSDINEPDVRRFLLGALFLRIYAEREAWQRRAPQKPADLVHLLVLEEAHHFLRNPQGHGPGTELMHQSNLLLADAFAELRAYGQGILVADQAPAELAPAVLRNTATKLAHALFYEADCRAMSDAMGLSEEEQQELRRLAPGDCVVASPALPLPVTCRIQNVLQHEGRLK